MRITYLLILFIWTACTAQKAEIKEIDFIITKSVVSDSIINFKVVNNSSITYVLPMMIFPEHEKINAVIPAGERSLFFVHTNVYTQEDDLIEWSCYNCFPHHDSEDEKEVSRLDDLWKERKKKLKLTDLVILKPNETKSFEIIFKSERAVTSKSIFRMNGLNASGRYYLRLYYVGENTTYPAAILPTLEEWAEKENFKIYKKSIISNRVSLQL